MVVGSAAATVALYIGVSQVGHITHISTNQKALNRNVDCGEVSNWSARSSCDQS